MLWMSPQGAERARNASECIVNDDDDGDGNGYDDDDDDDADDVGTRAVAALRLLDRKRREGA